MTEGGPHIWAIVNALSDRFDPVTVILETPESKRALLRRRARKQGWISVTGQLGTMVLTRLGKRFLAARADRIAAENGLETSPREESADRRRAIRQFHRISRRNRPVEAFGHPAGRLPPAVAKDARRAALPGAELPRRHQSEIPRHERRLLGAGDGRRRKFRRDRASWMPAWTLGTCSIRCAEGLSRATI